MRQDLLTQYKEAQITPLEAGATVPEDVRKLFKNPSVVVDTNKTTPMSTLLGVYFAPYGKNGKPRAAGAGIGIRIRKGEYAFSTVNATIPEGYQLDVLVTWSNNKITGISMSVDAASDFNDVLAGKGKKRPRRDTLQPGLFDVYMEDPEQIAAKLNIYSVIKGDGTEEDWGYVTGAIEGKTERDSIPKDMWKFLKEEQKTDFGGTILRVFSVRVPDDQKARYKAFLAIEEQYRTLKMLEDEFQAATLPYEEEIAGIRAEKTKAIQEVEEKRDQDPNVIEAAERYSQTQAALEAQKTEFDKLG